ncbi:MAG: GT4 family glycosyltransferase PelF [Candidatus Omnitrophota bacterium]|nr:GT4 family glycosyltransferase PelF [Candidatus Omnitrophota bacterium]MBU1929307.1 GT4 family glycosyltransferase PelF [Candidatus Omnitrophota bacterium]MBU2035599.1 GT4 family glycosyltransferase PelF [Candidatus Omnitrophota bacterium]MBU2221071.1 GT4 family glycosyltransferase PelF [Candidatus Omnitrophota bacterium]MBU2258022.1 GT4 family glycosyltransferase PelF [Candidatus Omnitrophota bacterium]
MNILQVLPELNVGGVETGVVDLTRSLVKLGHKVVVISNGGDLVREIESSGALHYQLPVHKKSLFNALRLIPKLSEIIKKENIEIVHARSRVPAWIAYFASRRARAIFITTCHGYYKKHIFSQVMGWGKRVIVISNVIARHMIDDFLVPRDKVRLIPRSVDLDKFKYSSLSEKKGNDFHIGIIGRITPIKGHLHFIKAMAKVQRLIPRLKIWIVGDAPVSKEAYKDELKVLVKRLGLWHCTEFLGTQKDIPAIMKNLDVLVLATTTHEAFGRVIIEAQASGVPVVATSVGGVVDIIEDKANGLLVPPADPQAMSDAVIKIFQDKEMAARLAENAYKRVKEKYNIELMVKNTLDVYREALANFRILVIKFSSLGDVILTTAAIRAIREKFGPNYKISFLVGEESKSILLRCPYIDELLVCDLKNRDKGLRGLLKLGGYLRRKNFDKVIDLQNNRNSHILSRLTLAFDQYGYDNKKFGFLLNHKIKDNLRAMDPVSHQFRILKMLDIELKDTRLELWPSPEDERYINEFLGAEWLSLNQKIVGINISASARWATKIWPISKIARLCDELSRQDTRVVITGAQEDLDQAGNLINAIKGAKPINACGKTTINQLACLIAKCGVYISMDSAPMHIASCVGTPFIALFGPTDPKRHLPPAKKYTVIKKDLPCSPCYRSKCKKQKCMNSITWEEVLEAVNKLL